MSSPGSARAVAARPRRGQAPGAGTTRRWSRSCRCRRWLRSAGCRSAAGATGSGLARRSCGFFHDTCAVQQGAVQVQPAFEAGVVQGGEVGPPAGEGGFLVHLAVAVRAIAVVVDPAGMDEGIFLLVGAGPLVRGLDLQPGEGALA